MIAAQNIVASSLNLEPNRALVLRDLYRAENLGLEHILVNENMLNLAATEAIKANLRIGVSAAVGFPIGQWFWSMKKAAIDELAAQQTGPSVVMHSVGSWLDRSDAAATERNGIGKLHGDKWLMTSLSLIPSDRISELADEAATMGITNLILSNGVAASKIDPCSEIAIGAISKAAAGRFKITARPTEGSGEAVAQAALDAGADAICSDDFWELAH